MTINKFSIENIRLDVLAANAREGIPFVLTRDMVVDILKAYIAGLVSGAEVANWAEFFDVNEDIELETDELLPDVLFELSSPEVNGGLNKERALELVDILRASRMPG